MRQTGFAVILVSFSCYSFHSSVGFSVCLSFWLATKKRKNRFKLFFFRRNTLEQSICHYTFCTSQLKMQLAFCRRQSLTKKKQSSQSRSKNKNQPTKDQLSTLWLLFMFKYKLNETTAKLQSQNFPTKWNKTKQNKWWRWCTRK